LNQVVDHQTGRQRAKRRRRAKGVDEKKASNEGRAGKKEKVPKLQVGKVRFRPL